MQQVQKARDSVNGTSKTLENFTKQLNTPVIILSLLEEQERPQTASVGQQLQAIIERVEELRGFFDKIKSEQQRKAIPQFLHALKSRNSDDKELAGIFNRLDRARLELTLRISVAPVGLIGNLQEGFCVAFDVFQETNTKVKQVLGRDLNLAIRVKDKQYQQTSICFGSYQVRENTQICKQ